MLLIHPLSTPYLPTTPVYEKSVTASYDFGGSNRGWKVNSSFFIGWNLHIPLNLGVVGPNPSPWVSHRQAVNSNSESHR